VSPSFQAHAPFPSISRPPELAGLSTYALVDPYFGEYPDSGLDVSASTSFSGLARSRSDAWEGRFVQVAESTEPLIDPRRLPYLVYLEGAEDPLLARMIDAAFQEHQAVLTGQFAGIYRVGTLIETSLPPKLLMQRLERMWECTPGIGTVHYVRVADRRVVEALAELVGQESFSRWLGPIARWHILARDFSWKTFRGAVDETTFPEEDCYARHRRLESQALVDTELVLSRESRRCFVGGLQAVSRALTIWQQHGHVPEAGMLARAWQGVKAAAKHGLESPADQAVFAYCWVRHADCAAHPSVAEALRRYRAGEQGFAEAWTELVLELHAPANASSVNSPDSQPFTGFVAPT